MDENQNSIIREIKAEPGLSLMMLFLFLLIIGVLVASFMIFQTSNRAINPTGNNPAVTSRPLAAGEFTPILNKTLGVAFSYNVDKNSVDIKKLEIIPNGIRQDLRGIFSEYSASILDANKRVIHTFTLPVIKQLNLQYAGEIRYSDEKEFNNYVVLPYFSEAKYLSLKKFDTEINEIPIPEDKKEKTGFIPKAEAQSIKDPALNPYQKYKIFYLGIGYEDEDVFNRDVRNISQYFNTREPFTKDFFDEPLKKMIVKDELTELLKGNSKLANCYSKWNEQLPPCGIDAVIESKFLPTNNLSALSHVVVLINSKTPKAGGLKGMSSQGNHFAVLESQAGFQDQVQFMNSAVHHVLGVGLGYLYDQSATGGKIKLEDMKIFSNCSSSSRGENFWREIPGINVTRGCNGVNFLYAPYNTSCNSVMALSCLSSGFNDVEKKWISEFVIPQFPPPPDDALCSSTNCTYCRPEKCVSDEISGCFMYAGKYLQSSGARPMPVCMSGKGIFRDNVQKNQNICIPSNNVGGDVVRVKECTEAKSRCYCKSDEGCTQLGCVTEFSSNFCGYPESNNASVINANRACSGSNFCSLGMCCPTGQTTYQSTDPKCAYGSSYTIVNGKIQCICGNNTNCVVGNEKNPNICFDGQCKPQIDAPPYENYRDYVCGKKNQNGKEKWCVSNDNCGEITQNGIIQQLVCKKGKNVTGGCCLAGEEWNGRSCVTSAECALGASRERNAENKCLCEDNKTECTGISNKCVKVFDDSNTSYTCLNKDSHLATMIQKPDFTIDLNEWGIPLITVPEGMVKGKKRDGGFKSEVTVKNLFPNTFKESVNMKITACLNFVENCTDKNEKGITTTIKIDPNDTVKKITFDIKNSENSLQIDYMRSLITVCVNSSTFEAIPEKKYNNNCLIRYFGVRETCPTDPVGYFCSNGKIWASYGGPDCEKGDVATDQACESSKPSCGGTTCQKDSVCDAGKFCVTPGKLPNGWGCTQDKFCKSGYCFKVIDKTKVLDHPVCLDNSNNDFYQ